MEGENLFNKKKFKAQVILSGKSMMEIAHLLGINQTTLYRKINGKSDFYRNEIYKLCNYLNISNPIEIFFADKIT